MTVHDARLVLVIAVTSAALFGRRATAEPYRLRAETMMTARSPTGFLALETATLASEPISAETLIWAGRDEIGGEADALVAAVRVRSANRRLELRLGRFFLLPGALLPVHIDGARGAVRLPTETSIELFGGVPVQPRFGSRPEEWLAGGRVAQSLGDSGAIGIAYAHRSHLGDVARDEIAFDFGLTPLDALDLSMRAAYDLDSAGISEAVAIAGLQTRRIRLELLGSHRSPSRLLPATSVFSVLGDAASDHFGGRLHARVAPRLDALAEMGVRANGDDRGTDLGLELILRLDEWGREHLVAEVRRVDMPDAGWIGLRGAARLELTAAFSAGLEAELVFVDGRTSPWPWALIALGFTPAPAWTLEVGFEASASPEDLRAFDAIFRAQYAWDGP